jgi:predicted negative regulator of RcsB-dependent stress response
MKENVDFVKDELNSEEKFLEGFVKVERFYKKFKALIIGLVSIAVIAVIGISVKNYNDEKNAIAANIAFDKVIADPKDTDSLNTLKESNNKLYEVALYLQAKKNGNYPDTNVPYLKELSEYEKALTNSDVSKLNTLSMQSDFLLKEFAIFNKALVLVNEGKYNEAKIALNLIPKSSKASELSKLLQHHLLTK